MAMLTYAKFHFSRLMATLIFGIWASESPPGPGERLKRPGLTGLKTVVHISFQVEGVFAKDLKPMLLNVLET